MWRDIKYAPEGVAVMTCIDGGTKDERNAAWLVKKGRLWWLKNENMYVYYTPTHFKFSGEF